MSSQARALPAPAGLESSHDKDRWRHILRQQRCGQHPHPDAGHSPACEALMEHALQAVEGMGTIAAYVSVGNEPCTRLLLEHLEVEDRVVLLPVLGPHLSRCWGRFTGTADLAERAPGRPPEPGGDPLPAEAVADVDALLIPALAIDRAGNRLGQGGGWYDRVLPLRREGALVLAMVYDDELTPSPLPTEPHDQRVDAVITPEQWFLLKRSVFASGS
ncbi:5-formyltetrahydrofolate cyclo-ligase [Actinomyces gaoshouyii]|uniref:5-formyltetrahydrofolate cyclo-ligase n=1 Tax=Actinomyces gaoshouyii TaxID=1960083 RepID=UPI0009C120EC|nr:5-formyltetrahydrofolate cyclo-ligase [Actinomyces gaoshouyii]ARD41124.1 5-formyltetrahydrofolate cyclo-ligase [Actinomyces gaoshouyii]